MTTVLFPDQHWCRHYGTPCTNANTWNECKLTACNRARIYPPVPVVEIKREERNKMTNKYMKEHLIDYTCVRCKHYKTSAEEVPCSYCSNNYQSQYEEAPQAKEFTEEELIQIFRDKFMERRAIGILEIEELIGELFE